MSEPIAIIACVDRRHNYDNKGWGNNLFLKHEDESQTISYLTKEEFDEWKKFLPVWRGKCMDHI